MTSHAITADTVAISKLTVAVESLRQRQKDHEEICAKRWMAAIILLVTNLLALIGGMAMLLIKSWHLMT